LQVSTGRVVDFRASDYLRDEHGIDTVPLIYPTHFSGGYVAWPKSGCRKPNALVNADSTHGLMVPSESYVLTKRFSSKEERRRVVAAVYDPSRLPKGIDQVGFENHLNYYHSHGRGLPKALARGLAGFLNSTLVDQYFRQFNGHTQVNAGDLRSMRYPMRLDLEAIGKLIGGAWPQQEQLDAIVDRVVPYGLNASAR